MGSRSAPRASKASADPACRERQLLLAGMQAFRQAVQRAHEGRRLAALQAHMFAAWRHLAASSGERIKGCAWRYGRPAHHLQCPSVVADLS